MFPGIKFYNNNIPTFNAVFVSLLIFMIYKTELEHAVAQLVEALRYKPEGRGFDSRWCHWNF